MYNNQKESWNFQNMIWFSASFKAVGHLGIQTTSLRTFFHIDGHGPKNSEPQIKQMRKPHFNFELGSPGHRQLFFHVFCG